MAVGVKTGRDYSIVLVLLLLAALQLQRLNALAFSTYDFH